MKSEQPLPAHVRPNLKPSFRTHAAFLGYIAIPVGLFLGFYEGLADDFWVRVVLITLCVLVSFAGFFWSYIAGNVRALYGRLRDYPRLHGQATTDSDSLDVLRQSTLELMTAISSMEQEEPQPMISDPRITLERLRSGVVTLATIASEDTSYRIKKQSLNKDKAVIVLEDVEMSLTKGDKVLVVDTADRYEMGTFKVIETIEKEKECYALGEDDVDGLWLAELKKTGESSVIVEKVAILVERGNE